MSSIFSGIKKVAPVSPTAKQMGTQTQPKQQPTPDLEKKKKKDPNALVDLTAEDTAYAGGMGQGGNAGQSYRKYKAKPAGMSEEQAPMFTPEAKMVNANDPMSDGWRWYKTKLDEQAVDVVKQAIVDQVKKNKINLVHKYGIKQLITAINQVAQKHASTPEKSLSDISIWVKELENMLERGKGGTFEEQQLDEKCWDTHKQVGMKNKGGKMVPNCVPKESVEEDELKELSKDTINDYISKSSAAVRGGRIELPKKVPSWKVAAGKVNPDSVMGKYAKVKAGDLQGVPEARFGGYYNPLDQERREQDSMDYERKKFKHDELSHELRNEPANNYQVNIDGRKWKVFKDKSHAEAVARKLRAKGKDVKIYITGESPNVTEGENLDEDLRKWFKEKWVRFGPDGKIRGDCARGDDSEGKPKCLPQSKAHSLGKKGRASAAARKRREDPNPERRGKAKNVATKKKTNESNDPGYPQALANLQYLASFIKFNPKMTGKEIKQMGPINPAQNIIKKALKSCDYIEQLLKAQNNIAVSSAMSSLKKELINWFNDGNKPLGDLLQGTIGKIKFPTNEEKCPHCSGELVSAELMNEKKDACYHKVKARYKVWPSAYASGALVKCRKKGASNWGKSKAKESSVLKGMLEALTDPQADQMIKNIIAQNPKGSAVEKIILNLFLHSQAGAYANNVIGIDDSEAWIDHATAWLEKHKKGLNVSYPELDLSDLRHTAENMYVDVMMRKP